MHPFGRSHSLTIPWTAARILFNFLGNGAHKKNKTYTERVETVLYHRFHFFELFDRIIGIEVHQVESSKLSYSVGSGLEYSQGFVECPEGSMLVEGKSNFTPAVKLTPPEN